MNGAGDSAKLKRNQVRVASDLGPEILALCGPERVQITNHRSFFESQHCLFHCMRVRGLLSTMGARLLLFGLRPGFRAGRLMFSPT